MNLQVIADIHLHSRFSLATSPSLTVESLAQAARRKGLDLIAAPDFTHPTWRAELHEYLAESDDGSGIYIAHGQSFVLATEVSCVWRQGGSVRRVHLLLTAPNFASVDRVCVEFSKVQRLESDGRPTLKLSAREVLGIAKNADERCQIIPAHAFTPWFGIFGSKTGFDSLEEAFGEDAAQLIAIESGLSANPEMMSNIPDCVNRAIVSFSDAHSTANLAREATVLEVPELTYDAVIASIANRNIVETLEWYPEHGKYHLDGHRKCGIRFTPEESRQHDNVCPVCNKPLTLGVLHRTEELSRKSHKEPGVGQPANPPQSFRHLLPLRMVITHAIQSNPNTKRSIEFHDHLIGIFGSELEILLRATRRELTRIHPYGPQLTRVGPQFAEAVLAARNGEVTFDPGYDGVYGSGTLNAEPSVRYSSGYGIPTSAGMRTP